MTERSLDRRRFLTVTGHAGVALCGVFLCPRWSRAGDDPTDTAKPDPAKLCYCGYTCPEECDFLRGTLTRDLELKQKAWAAWKIEERFGLAFDPAQAICHGCKAPDKPEGVVLQRCDVRSCARDRELECCIECSELPACDKDLWRRFPEFKAQVVTMQRRYRA
jgi:hypothetical protein